MMKIFTLFSFLFISIVLFAQQATNILSDEVIPVGEMMNIQVRQLRLANGMMVYLSPDPNMQDVYGAIVVKGGAKYDPAGGTGTAHFFEHMMFKGSENLGTVNYREERVYLDSIKRAYDLLPFSKDDPEFRKGIYRNINRLSQKAAEFAIPNEFSKVMSELGCTGLNAYTTYENIVYVNHFPVESIHQWVMLQTDRFSYPVFRLFQTELETVIEEKNRALDNMFYKVYRELYKNFYPNSVYGKQDVLGSVEDLRNPSISRLETYFKDYYVANNMALVLVGNFDPNIVMDELETSFGKWRDGHFEQRPDSRENAFEGRVAVKAKLTPIPVGILGFRTVPKGHPDELGLELIQELLSNADGTGLIDRLVTEQKIMDAGVFNDAHYDIGGSFIYYIPKMLKQSLSSGENLILAQLDSLKSGNFDQDILTAIIVNKRKELLLQLERPEQRARLLIDAYMSNYKISDLLSRVQRLEDFSKEEIMVLARKYYGPNYLAFSSKMGFKKSEQMKSPGFTPLNPKNKNASSEMALKVASMLPPLIPPHYIQFGTDVMYSDIIENFHFFYTKNPFNQIYTLNWRIGIGSWSKPQLEILSAYLNKVGSKNMPFQQFRKSLQRRGSSIETQVSRDYFYIRMQGFDANLAGDIIALNDFLANPEQNDEVLKKLLAEKKMDFKVLKRDPNMQSRVLNSYMLYGKDSPYLKQSGKKELKALTYADIKSILEDLLTYETQVHYVGTQAEAYVKQMISAYHPLILPLKHSTSPVDPVAIDSKANEVYFLNNKNALQSQIRLSYNTKQASADERLIMPLFNRYFGLGMSSVFFRQVREFHALAYHAYAYLRLPYYLLKPARMDVYMSTQVYKTNEALGLMAVLLDSLPEEYIILQPYQQAVLRSMASQAPGFRNRSMKVADWMGQGYQQDPRSLQFESVRQIRPDEISFIFGNFVKGHFHRINIVGNKSKIDLNQLSRYGSLRELKLKDIYRK